ncbi:MAG TPA: hypothetical protein VKB34_15645 [Povalibacter sp.]|nr:hypothetical protein [Povalibacter sp.]
MNKGMSIALHAAIGFLMLPTVLLAAKSADSTANDTTELERHSEVLGASTWSWRLVRYPYIALDSDDGPDEPMYAIEVTNGTTQPLLCQASMSIRSYKGDDQVAGSSVIMPGVTVPALANTKAAYPEGAPWAPQVSCTVKSLPPVPTVRQGCSFEIDGQQYLELPPHAMRHTLNDVVTVDFTVQQARSRASNVAIVDSVGEDDGFLAEVSQQYMEKRLLFRTTCPGQLFRLRFEFRSHPGARYEPDLGAVVIHTQ